MITDYSATCNRLQLITITDYPIPELDHHSATNKNLTNTSGSIYSKNRHQNGGQTRQNNKSCWHLVGTSDVRIGRYKNLQSLSRYFDNKINGCRSFHG
jgi:hypothetical protein